MFDVADVGSGDEVVLVSTVVCVTLGVTGEVGLVVGPTVDFPDVSLFCAAKPTKMLCKYKLNIVLVRQIKKNKSLPGMPIMMAKAATQIKTTITLPTVERFLKQLQHNAIFLHYNAMYVFASN